MSFPNIPDVAPAIDINREDVLNLILASIAFEELGLAHLINAEAEKIQFVVGTLHNNHNGPCGIVREGEGENFPPGNGGGNGGGNGQQPDIDDIIEMNNTVNNAMRNVIKTQMLLQFKLEDVLAIIKEEDDDKPHK